MLRNILYTHLPYTHNYDVEATSSSTFLLPSYLHYPPSISSSSILGTIFHFPLSTSLPITVDIPTAHRRGNPRGQEGKGGIPRQLPPRDRNSTKHATIYPVTRDASSHFHSSPSGHFSIWFNSTRALYRLFRAKSPLFSRCHFLPHIHEFSKNNGEHVFADILEILSL